MKRPISVATPRRAEPGVLRVTLGAFFTAIAVIAVLVAVIVGVTAYGLWYDNTHKRLLQTVHAPTGGEDYLLMTDVAGFGDRAWYVYQRPAGEAPTPQMQRAHDVAGCLFWNYSELGDHSTEPRLRLVHDRYLAFTRGGRYYSLYDLDAHRVVLNDENPWNNFTASNEYRQLGAHPSLQNLELAMDGWVTAHLDAPIRAVIGEAIPVSRIAQKGLRYRAHEVPVAAGAARPH